MRARHGIAVTLGIGLLLGNAEAQNVISAPMLGQPLVYMKDGALYGCGVRLIVVDSPKNPTAAPVAVYDLSFNLHMPGTGIMKGGSMDVPSSQIHSGQLDKNKTKPVQLAAFWLKAKENPATSPLQGTAKGADAGTILYAADLDAVFPLFNAQVRGEPLLVGTKRQGAKTERLFTGVVKMKDDEQEQLNQCMKEFLAQATK